MDVLVLNANFEPINVCNLHRALNLMLSGKASLIANGRGVVKTVSRTYPCPSIIRLEQMIQRPHVRVRLTRREVFRRDNYTCQYCGKKLPNLTIDHVIPKRLGGRQTWGNVVAACAACNHRKGGRLPEEAGMRPIKPPQEPPMSALYVFGKYLGENADWLPYVEGW
jgi:5-methylcytosine-specific restriction endonuclease McrA